MHRAHVRRIAVAQGLAEPPADWRGLDAIWPIVERIGAEGGVFVVKLDGERAGGDQEPRYTALISGTHLRRPIRSDGNVLEECVARVLCEYAAHEWGLALPC